jgi:hypothetical protein
LEKVGKGSELFTFNGGGWMKKTTPAQWAAMYAASLRLEALAHKRTAHDLHQMVEVVRRHNLLELRDWVAAGFPKENITSDAQ